MTRQHPTRAEIVEVLDEKRGISQTELGAEWGFSRRTARGWLAAYGLTTEQNAYKHYANMAAAIEGGCENTKQIAEYFDIAWITAKRWLEKLGFDEMPDRFVRSNIRETQPLCGACGDPVDPADDIWGGVGRVHYLCAQRDIKRGIKLPCITDLRVGDDVTWNKEYMRYSKPVIVKSKGCIVEIYGDVAIVTKKRGKPVEMPLFKLSRENGHVTRK